MKKALRILLSFLLIISVFAGCSSNSSSGINEEEVLKLVKEYKTEQYTIQDPSNAPSPNEIADKVKDYLSKDALEKQQASRIFGLAPDLSKKTNKKIELEDIKLENKRENENGSIDYDYTVKLKLYDEETSEVLEVNGQISISDDDGLVITRDWENKTAFEKYLL